MKTIGIICEYNPLHLGHKKQMDQIRMEFGPDCAIVCLMSGNFVQRGAPAIVDKSLRAQAAVACGADLVLELPITYALSSAEGFAAGGVRILSQMCDFLCFGAENADKEILMNLAAALLSPAFAPFLHQELETGKSFPAARQTVLEKMGLPGTLLSLPNNILAVEYCKAILAQNSRTEAFPIHRQGNYHAEDADKDNPSATSLRNLMLSDQNWASYVPAQVQSLLECVPLHSLCAGEKAILARLRTMTDKEFESLPYGSEGLWRKFMRACRTQASLEEILAATKSKRYTRTRLDRMVMCAFLGITAQMLAEPVPYVRVLAFNDTGRSVLKDAKKQGVFLNAGERAEHPYWELEKRCENLYGLFCEAGIAPAGTEENRRVFYHKENA